MMRKIYVIVTINNDDMGFISIFSGNNQNKIHPFQLNCKAEAPHLHFFDKLRSLVNLTQIEAIAFILSMDNFNSFAEFYNFRQNCYEICKSNGIFYSAFQQSFIDAFVALSQTKTMVEEGQQLLIISSMFDMIQGITVVREKIHYRHFKSHPPTKFINTLKWKKEFLDGSNPKKVIFLDSIISDPMKQLKKMFDCHQETINMDSSCEQNAVIEMIFHVMGQKISPAYIPEMFRTRGAVHITYEVLITVDENETVPFGKSAVVDVVNSPKTLKFTVRGYPMKSMITLKEIDLTSFKSCKKVKVTLKVDANGFYELKAEPFETEKLDEKLSKISISESAEASFKKAKFIFDKQNFRIFVGDNDKNMQIIKDSDGLEKIPISIAFIKERPNVGNVAKEFYKQKSDSVIFDLIKLCSISNADVMNPKWGFKLEKGEDEAIIVTFETPDGEKKASAAFLLAFIFKHGLGMIKKQTGKRMTEIEVGFDGFTPNEILKTNFTEAAKLKKVDIVFV